MSFEGAPLSARDGQLRSPFTTILEGLCLSCIGAIAAGLVDEEGENVDLASLPLSPNRGTLASMPAYRIKLSLAHLQLVMREAIACGGLGRVRQLWVQASEYAYVLVDLHEGYLLVLVCTPDAIGTISARALRECEVGLCREAGWPLPQPQQICWRRTHVRMSEKGVPGAVRWAFGRGEMVGDGRWLWVTVQPRASRGLERVYQVTTPKGTSLELVREPTGFWFLGGTASDLDDAGISEPA
jgi:hypothetical protein